MNRPSHDAWDAALHIVKALRAEGTMVNVTLCFSANQALLAAKADAIAWGAEDLRTRYFKLLGDDGEKAQSEFVAGDWKTRWLPSLNGLLELNGNSGHFVGDQLTHADLAVWDVLDAILENIQSASLDNYSELQAFYDSVRSRPAVAAYVESRTA